MVTKDQLSEDLNEMLDTQMDWSKMKKDDLELLHELVDEGALIEPMAKHIASEKGQDVLDEKVKSWEPGTIITRLM